MKKKPMLFLHDIRLIPFGGFGGATYSVDDPDDDSAKEKDFNSHPMPCQINVIFSESCNFNARMM